MDATASLEREDAGGAMTSCAVELEVTVFLAGKCTPVAGGRGGLPSDGRGVRWWNYTMVRSHERTTAGRGGEGGAEAAAWRRRKRGREGGVPERVIVVVVWWEEVQESKVGSSMRVKQTHAKPTADYKDGTTDDDNDSSTFTAGRPINQPVATATVRSISPASSLSSHRDHRPARLWLGRERCSHQQRSN